MMMDEMMSLERLTRFQQGDAVARSRSCSFATHSGRSGLADDYPDLNFSNLDTYMGYGLISGHDASVNEQLKILKQHRFWRGVQVAAEVFDNRKKARRNG
jgi:hypothetical protein